MALKILLFSLLTESHTDQIYFSFSISPWGEISYNEHTAPVKYLGYEPKL